MLSKVYEWLRAADLKPDDAMVTSRTKAVEDLESKIRESGDYSLLLGTVTVAIGGCERVGEQSPVFTTLLECVRTQSPAFPSAISENGLQLRMICCLGLGELLVADNDDESDQEELMVASLLVSGLGLKPKEAGRHLDNVFDELNSVAEANLQKQAVARRERDELDWDDFNSLKGSISDPPNFNQKLLPTLKKMLENLQKQQESDREELEVMWWLYNGYSDRLGRQVKSVAPHLAAAAIASELGDRVTPPATVGLKDLVTQAAVRDRTAAQLKAQPISKIIAEFGETGRKLLLPSTDNVRDFVRSTGVLFPLTWLCMRIEESNGASGWETELRTKTGLASDHTLSPGELAARIFVERQTQRVYQSLTEGVA
jgi:hypothetical protein